MSKCEFDFYNEINNKMFMPFVTLTNGLKIANFSSPHEFKFEDGSILNKCSDYRANLLKVDFIENKIFNEKLKIYDIKLDFGLSEQLKDQIDFIINYVDEFDIILIPLSMLNAMKNHNKYNKKISLLPFRCIRTKNRLDKTIRIDEFCI